MMVTRKLLKEMDNANFFSNKSKTEYKEIANILISKIVDNLRSNNKKLTYNEGAFLIKYYAKESLANLKVNKNVEINILSRYDMNKKYNKRGSKEVIQAVATPASFRINFSDYLVENIISTNPEKVLRALRTVFHETKHIEQGVNKNINLSNYVFALELIAMYVDPQMYTNNYKNFYRENDAEYYAMDEVISQFSDVENFFAGKAEYKKEISKFKQGSTEDVTTILGRYKDYNGNIILEGTVYPEGERIKILELIAQKYIYKYPQKALEEFPVLNLAFNTDGTQKSNIQLLNEAETKLMQAESANERTDIQNLYTAIITQRYAEDYYKDIDELKNYANSMVKPNNLISNVIQIKEEMGNSNVIVKKLQKDFIRYGIGVSLKDKIRRRMYINSGARNAKKQKKLQGTEVRGYLDRPKENLEQYRLPAKDYAYKQQAINDEISKTEDEYDR